MKRYFVSIITFINLLANFIIPQNKWLEKDSDHFRIIFKENHAYLVSRILNDAENSLNQLMKIFDYVPSEKIVLNTYDIYDYGFGSATSIPQNYIRIEIEPFESGYEIVQYNDRIQWLINHELVHILISDQASKAESFFRSIFSKPPPEQSEPLSTFYSLLTNYERYTPQWHQEAIAVFIETWLSGGFGRIFGNFDEMYFRSMVLEERKFPSPLTIDAITSHNSFLLETIYYLYGTRFIVYLTNKYDSDKLINWFKEGKNSFYSNYISNFENIYRIDFDEAWDDFIRHEKDFQSSNIQKILLSPLTYINKISSQPQGWVSQPFYNKKKNSVIYAFHRSHQLAEINCLNLSDFGQEELITLPTPSMHQVSSLAYDDISELLFYTTNNNQLYRDLWSLNLRTNEKQLLFEDVRIGNITISSTHELWGIQHSEGKAILAYSAYPYVTLQKVIVFDFGDELYQLSVSPSGKFLSAILHRSNGVQSIILINLEDIKVGKALKYQTISDAGTPENPSWSQDENFIFWNAYVNGVSNIYRINLLTSEIEPLSNVLRGLFKPIEISKDSLFAFEFTTDGFIPVLISQKPAQHLNAIEYMGQRTIVKNPKLADWILKPGSDKVINEGTEKEYNGLSNLKIISFLPVITGFQKQKVLGFFTHLSDPLINNDLILEVGYSPFKENPVVPKWHAKLNYEYKRKIEFGIEYNAMDFYDLFNERKRGMIGTKIRLAHNYYWVYDNPLKAKQRTEVALYTGVEFINDNMVRVSQPDFMVAQTEYNYSYLRKTIGSSDYENGNEFNFTLRGFGTNPRDLDWSAQTYVEWDHYLKFFFSHNTLHWKLAGGYHYDNVKVIQSRFYFGGFGNREVENTDVKQYRKVFRLPGIPIYNLSATQFVKILLENNLPPIRFDFLSIGNHYLSHIDASVYSQFLYAGIEKFESWYDLGGQVNIVFKHWFNLESTFSAGIAKAWKGKTNSWESFLSLKLLKN
jgi:hypothetical protein